MRATIIRWPNYGTFGFALDSEQRELFVHSEHIGNGEPLGRRHDEIWGMEIECDVQPPRGRGRALKATNVRIIGRAEQQPEPMASRPAIIAPQPTTTPDKPLPRAIVDALEFSDDGRPKRKKRKGTT
jgi:hypothetical protein